MVKTIHLGDGYAKKNAPPDGDGYPAGLSFAAQLGCELRGVGEENEKAPESGSILDSRSSKQQPWEAAALWP